MSLRFQGTARVSTIALRFVAMLLFLRSTLTTRTQVCALLPSRQNALHRWSTSSTLSSTSTTSESPTHIPLPESIDTFLDINLPEGRCVGVSLPKDWASSQDAVTSNNIENNPKHWARQAFHPDEISYGLELAKTAPASSASFWLGRLAMRLALNFPDYPILKDEHGRPQLWLPSTEADRCDTDPRPVWGSISHKQNAGVALVSTNDKSTGTNGFNNTVFGVGVDLEMTTRPGKRSIAPKVLTDKERKSLGCIPGVTVEEEVMLRFSLKEAIYKAAHPVLCQYVSFQEAEVTPHADGTATCTWNLTSQAHHRIKHVTAHWRKLEDPDFFLTSGSVEGQPSIQPEIQE